MGNLKEIVGIKNDQDFQTLVDTGTLTYGDETIEYSDDAIYFTPETEESSSIDAYTKTETDALLDGKVSKNGDTMSGGLSIVTESSDGAIAPYIDLYNNQGTDGIYNNLNIMVNSQANGGTQVTSMRDMDIKSDVGNINMIANSITLNGVDVVDELNSKVDLNNSSQNITANDITLQGFSMFDFCAGLSADKADNDASNITTTSWIEKLLTGKKEYGDKIIDIKMMSIPVSSSGSTTRTEVSNYIKFESGLLIQWGQVYTGLDVGDLQNGEISFGTPFYNDNSYVISLQGRRKEYVSSRDTTFIPRNLASNKCGFMWYGQSYNQDRWYVQWIAIGKWKEAET